MRRVERRGDLADDPERAAWGQAPVLDEERLQVASLDAGHRDVEEPVLLARVVDGHDVRVVERSGQLRLPQEALVAAVRLAERRREQLQRRGPAETHVLCPVDDARPTPPERLDEPVAPHHRLEAPVDTVVDRHRPEF